MSEYRQLKRQVGDLLVGLGTTPDEVASSLGAAGVRGTPRSNRTCPIALYLSAVMGADPRVRSVTVGHCSMVIALATPDLRPAGRLVVQLPKPVRRFVSAFDALRYPENVRRPSAPLQVLSLAE
jgi:hypothetical protein